MIETISSVGNDFLQMLGELRVLNELRLIQLIYGSFLFLICLQVIAAFRCLYVIVDCGVQKDIQSFLNEYWKWSHLRKNSLMLSLWLSSCGAYLSVWIVTLELADVSIMDAFYRAPIHSLYVIISLVALVIYTLSRSNDQVTATKHAVARLKKMRLYTAFKSMLKQVQGAPINATSWGMWVGALASGTEWLSEHFVKRQIDAEMKDALINFSIYASLEYLFRMSIVAVAVWVVYH